MQISYKITFCQLVSQVALPVRFASCFFKSFMDGKSAVSSNFQSTIGNRPDFDLSPVGDFYIISCNLLSYLSTCRSTSSANYFSSETTSLFGRIGSSIGNTSNRKCALCHCATDTFTCGSAAISASTHRSRTQCS